MNHDLFAVLAEPTRRKILQALAVERLAVGELVEELGASQPTVSKHLKVLRTAGLVETEAVGQKRFYSLTPQPLSRVSDWIQELQESVSPSPSVSPLAAQKLAPQEAAPQALDSSPATEPSPLSEQEPAAQVSTQQAQLTSAQALAGGTPQPAITFTPLVPFTPQPLDQITPSTPARGIKLATVPSQETEIQVQLESPHEPEEETPQAPSSQLLESLDAVREEAALRHYPQPGASPQANSPAEEKGLIAKLTRWGRRAGR